MSVSKEQIEELLAFDGIDVAESIAGRCSAATSLGVILNIDNNRRKREALAASGDTHFGMKIPEFLQLLKNIGFEQVLCEPIPDTKDTYFVFWRDGILVSFDTYFDGKSINGGNAYFFYECDPDAPHALQRCSYGMMVTESGKHLYDVGFDIREAFRYRIERLEEVGRILPTWPSNCRQPFIWLLHYKDTKVTGYDYKAINKARIAKFPEHVQAAVRGYVEGV